VNFGTRFVEIGVLTSTWSAVAIRGQFVSDLFFFGGGLLLLAAGRLRLRGGGDRALLARLATSAWLLVMASAITEAARDTPISEMAAALRLATTLTAVPLIVLMYVRNTSDGRRLGLLLLASSAVNGAFAIADMLLGLRISPLQETWNVYLPLALERAVGLTGHPNIIGYAATAAIPLAPALLSTSSSSAMRWCVATGAALAAGGLVLSGSRGGALGVAVGMIYLLLMSRHASVRRIVLVTIGFATMLPIFFRDLSLVSRILGGDDAAASNASRAEGLDEAFRLVNEHFPLGIGFRAILEIHSGALALIVGGGLIGATGAAIWFAGVWRMTRLDPDADRVTAQLVTGAKASSVGLAAFLVMSPVIYHRYAVVPISIALALTRLSKGHISPPSATVTSGRADP
jgi:hypothetical protein